jgi:hypothetical protein
MCTRLDPKTKETMQLALVIQSTFLDVSCSATAGHLPHSVLEFYCVESTTYATQLKQPW